MNFLSSPTDPLTFDSDVSSLEKQLEISVDRMATVRTGLTGLRQKLDQIKDWVDIKAKDNQSSIQRIDELTAELAELKTSELSLKEQGTKSSTDMLELQQQIQACHDEKTQLESDLADSTNRLSSIHSKINKWKTLLAEATPDEFNTVEVGGLFATIDMISQAVEKNNLPPPSPPSQPSSKLLMDNTLKPKNNDDNDDDQSTHNITQQGQGKKCKKCHKAYCMCMRKRKYKTPCCKSSKKNTCKRIKGTYSFKKNRCKTSLKKSRCKTYCKKNKLSRKKTRRLKK
jgi:hypothetical protein